MEEVETLEAPPALCGYYTLGKRYQFNHLGCFVFASDLKGSHESAVGIYAAKYFGARHGLSQGYAGRSYGIPVQDKESSPISLEELAGYIKTFISCTDITLLESDPLLRTWFFVTPIGTGSVGYRHEDIAPLFKGAANCWFPDIWRPYLGDSPGLYR